MGDLLIDLGNSRLKWAQNAPNRWTHSAVTHRERDLAGALDEAWGSMQPPARVLYVSVATAERSAELESWIGKRWNVPVRRVQSQREQFGVINTYRDPTTLGADRWVALLGARQRCERDCAIVSCGTAVTLDVLTGEGVFAGGVIFPGLYMLRRSLDVGTAGVRPGMGDDSSCLAHTTADGVAAGTVFGLAGAIERVLLEFEQALSKPVEVLLTGGDAQLLMSHLARPAVHMPDLVLKGLARVAEVVI